MGLEIIRELDTYTEASPSGTGVRLFLRGDLPAHGRKKGNYENYQSGRYVTVTGQHIEGTPLAIEHRQEQLRSVHSRIFGDGKAEAQGPAKDWRQADMDDAELVRCASAAKNGAKFSQLWRGEVVGHNSASEADLALCNHLAFWCGPNENRIADLFAQSGLYRSKWNREDYRKRTIGKVLAGRTEFYSPRERASRNGHARNGSASPGSNGHASHDATPTPGANNQPPDKHNTDKGNARRVVERHGKDLHYCHPWKSWQVWDELRWAEDFTGEALRRVKETQDSLYSWASAQLQALSGQTGEGDEEEDEALKARKGTLKAIMAHVLKWEDWKRTTASLSHAQSEPGIPIVPEDLDRDLMLLNVQNGTINLRTGELLPHRREDLITKLAPVIYDPKAECPLWMKFLRRILPDESLIRYMQRVAGYCMTGDVGEQILWFLHGCGANGKSTYLRVLLDMLGDYGMQAVSDLLMVKHHESHPTERADLFGRRLVCTIETEEGKRMAEALMKQLTGADRIRARKLYKDFFDFSPTHKIMLAANHKPVIRGTDHAVWRRIKLVPFTVTIPEEERDKSLPEKLKAELSGVLNWALAGCLKWQREGLAEPEVVRLATEAYQAEQDSVREFLNECCVFLREARIKASALLAAYIEWSGDKLMNPKAFGQRMQDNGYESKRQGTGCFYHGIGLPAGEESEPL